VRGEIQHSVAASLFDMPRATSCATRSPIGGQQDERGRIAFACGLARGPQFLLRTERRLPCRAEDWARVRELVGYYRYDTAAELTKLNQIWDADVLFANYFLPQQKLISKQREGAKVIKR
jgi:hypothetical protein